MNLDPCTEKAAIIDLAVRLETTLDHSPEKIWPYVLNWNLWVDTKDFVARRVAGHADREGEVKGLSHFDANGRLDMFFFRKAIKLVPPKLLIYKIAPPHYIFDAETGRSSEMHSTGYDIISLYQQGKQTLLTLDVLNEVEIPGIRTKDQVQAFAEEYRVSTEKNWVGRYFPKLKELLAKS